jgi:hypothetical protein
MGLQLSFELLDALFLRLEQRCHPKVFRSRLRLPVNQQKKPELSREILCQAAAAAGTQLSWRSQQVVTQARFESSQTRKGLLLYSVLRNFRLVSI